MFNSHQTTLFKLFHWYSVAAEHNMLC